MLFIDVDEMGVMLESNSGQTREHWKRGCRGKEEEGWEEVW